MEDEQKIIRVFPRRTKWTPTDDLAFVGGPPLFDLPKLPVFVSVAFTWDRSAGEIIRKEWRTRCDDVYIGGPAYDDAGAAFVAGRFLKAGVTITSRGCPKRCPFCLASKREGLLRCLDIQPGYIVQDNNLLACPRHHIERVFEMLRQQREPIKFSGGLDIDYLEPWHVELLKSIRLDEIWVACDCERDLGRLDKARDLLADFSIEKKRCYVLIGFGGERPEQAEKRLEAVYDKGFLPFAQPYKSERAEFRWCVGSDAQRWIALVRKWSRPAAYRAKQPL